MFQDFIDQLKQTIIFFISLGIIPIFLLIIATITIKKYPHGQTKNTR